MFGISDEWKIDKLSAGIFIAVVSGLILIWITNIHSCNIQSRNRINPATNLNSGFETEVVLIEKSGEIIEPYTKLRFFCTYASNTYSNVDFSVHSPDGNKTKEFRLWSLGDSCVFEYSGLKFRITLKYVYDGGEIDQARIIIKLLN